MVALVLAALAPTGAALSHRVDEGGTVTWYFASPGPLTTNEGIQLTCRTDVDLRDDPIAVDDPVNEHVRLSCGTGVGTYCDHPSWTPDALHDGAFCGDAGEMAPCEGVLFSFTGVLRIVPTTGGAFEVTYDGYYADWTGTC